LYIVPVLVARRLTAACLSLARIDKFEGQALPYYINLNQDIVDMFEVKKHVKKDNLDCTKRQLAFKVEVACHKYAGQVVPSMNKIYNCVKSCYDDMQNNLWVQRTTLSTTPSI
jgi:hypothetical protein